MKRNTTALAFWSICLVACTKVQPADTTQQPPPSTEKPGSGTETAPPMGNGPVPSAAPARPNPMVWLEPVDLTTSVGETPLRLSVDNLGAPVGEGRLAEIAAEFSLVEWPEMRSVKTTVDSRDLETEAFGRRTFVTIRPEAPLAGRWYALRLAKVPSGFTVPTIAETAAGTGPLLARFRPDSYPTLTGVRICQKGDSASTTIHTSEAVVGEDAQEKVVLSGGLERCDTIQLPSPTLAVSEFAYKCRMPAVDRALSFEFHAGFSARSGVPLRTKESALTGRYSFTLNDAEKWPENCWYYSAWRE